MLKRKHIMAFFAVSLMAGAQSWANRPAGHAQAGPGVSDACSVLAHREQHQFATWGLHGVMALGTLTYAAAEIVHYTMVRQDCPADPIVPLTAGSPPEPAAPSPVVAPAVVTASIGRATVAEPAPTQAELDGRGALALPAGWLQLDRPTGDPQPTTLHAWHQPSGIDMAVETATGRDARDLHAYAMRLRDRQAADKNVRASMLHHGRDGGRLFYYFDVVTLPHGEGPHVLNLIASVDGAICHVTFRGTQSAMLQNRDMLMTLALGLHDVPRTVLAAAPRV